MNAYLDGLLKARKDALASLNAALSIIAPVVELVNSLNQEISLEYRRCAGTASTTVPDSTSQGSESTASIPVKSEFEFDRDSPGTAGPIAEAVAESDAASAPTPAAVKREEPSDQECDQDDVPLIQRYARQAVDGPRRRTVLQNQWENQLERLFRDTEATKKARRRTRLPGKQKYARVPVLRLSRVAAELCEQTQRKSQCDIKFLERDFARNEDAARTRVTIRRDEGKRVLS